MPCSIEVKAYVSQWKSLIVDDGVVHRKFERPAGGVLFYKLLVPRSMRAELLELIHAWAACHLGVRKTIDQVQRRAYWFSWSSDTDRFADVLGRTISMPRAGSRGRGCFMT